MPAAILVPEPAVMRTDTCFLLVTRSRDANRHVSSDLSVLQEIQVPSLTLALLWFVAAACGRPASVTIRGVSDASTEARWMP